MAKKIGILFIMFLLAFGFCLKIEARENSYEISLNTDKITITLKNATYTGKGIGATAKATSGLSVTLTYYNDSSCKAKTTTKNAVAAGGKPKKVGTYYAIGTTAGNSTYKAAKSSCVKAVVIKKATNTITVTLKKSIYNGKGVAANVQAASGETVTLTYYSDATCKTRTTTKNATKTGGTPKSLGTYYVKGSVPANTNYNSGTLACTKAIVIKKLTDKIKIKLVKQQGPHRDNADSAIVRATSTSGLPVTMTYYTDSSCTTKTTKKMAPTVGGLPTVAGTYYAIGTTAGNESYDKGVSACTEALIIEKVDDAIKLTSVSKAYTGKEIPATVKSNSGLSVTVTYYSDSTCKTKTTTENAAKAGGAPTAVGTYYAVAKTAGDGLYNAAKLGCTKAVVIDKAFAKITCANKTYNGASQKIAKCTGGTIENASKVNVGSYTINCKGDSDHQDATPVLCSMEAVSLANATISSIADKSYTGSQITPNPTVKLDSQTLVKDVDYTLSYQSNTNPGTAKVIISGKGNYKGSKTTTFKITAFTVYFYGTSIIDTGLASKVTLSGSTDIPKVESNKLKLAKNTNYFVSFNHKTSSGTNKFIVDLYPNTLPEITVSSTSTSKHTVWRITSSSDDMKSCKLRFMDNIQEKDEKDIVITNITAGTYATIYRNENTKLGTLPTPTRTGYTFQGWYNSPSGGKKVSKSTVVTNDLALYSHWEAKEVRVYYLHDNGKLGNKYKKYNEFISSNGTEAFYQSVNYGSAINLYDYTEFGLSKNDFSISKGAEWCTTDGGKCFNQAKNYSFDSFKDLVVDLGTYYALILKIDWEYILPDSYKIPSTYSDIGKSFSSETLKYKVIRKNNTNQYYAMIWVKDASKQINSANNNQKGGQRRTLISNEVTKYFTKKGLIAVNGSFTWDGRANIPVIATKGTVARNTRYRTGRMNGETYSSLMYGILGVSKDGNLVGMSVSKSYLLNAKTTDEKLSELGYKSVENWIKANGIRNTWAITSFQTSNWTTSVDKADYRTTLCQVDAHNFVLTAEYDNPKNIAYELHKLFNCRTVVNLDGGGSSAMFYKTNKMSNAETIRFIDKGDNRYLADMLYFAEQ